MFCEKQWNFKLLLTSHAIVSLGFCGPGLKDPERKCQ